MASDPEGQLSDQSDIPANSEVSEVVINCVVSKDNLIKMVWSKNYYSSFSLCMQKYRMCKYSCVLSLRSMAAQGAGGLLPYKRLMGMCRWMGSHFHDWIDYNGVAFSESY